MRMNMMMIILQIVTTIKMIITYFRVYYEKKNIDACCIAVTNKASIITVSVIQRLRLSQ